MRIFNQQELKSDVARVFGGKGRGDNQDKFVTWVSESVVKWLLKNDQEFVATFTSPITAKALTVFQTEGAGLEAYHYIDSHGQKQRAYLENEFDIKDARNGILKAYVPKASLHWWLYEHKTYKFVEVRDFMLDLIVSQPETDLRRYTLDQMSVHLERWHRDLERRAEQERKAMAAALAKGQVDEETFHRLILDVESALLVNPDIFNAERLDLLQRAWAKLINGVDYSVIGNCGNYTALRLLSPNALLWEGTAQGSCISWAAYRSRLHDSRIALVSLREGGNLSRCVYTSELERLDGAWAVVQFESLGYRFSAFRTRLYDIDLNASKAALAQVMARSKLPTVNEFTVNRHN